jgi:hypothetical protein
VTDEKMNDENLIIDDFLKPLRELAEIIEEQETKTPEK